MQHIKKLIPITIKERTKKIVQAARVSIRIHSASVRRTPDFLIIGVQKGGTTSLYNLLLRHRFVQGALTKEVHYFDFHYGLGAEWYRAHFGRCDRESAQRSTPQLVTGEASPYYVYHPHAMHRIAKDLPDAKVILMLRNPIDRAYSSYHHQIAKKRERLTFEEAIEAEPTRLAGEQERFRQDPYYFGYNHAHFAYLDRGRYFEQVLRCFQLISKERCLILQSERFFHEPYEQFARILNFLGLPAQPHIEHHNANPREYPPMKAETRQRLSEHFAPANRRLYDVLGEKFDWS